MPPAIASMLAASSAFVGSVRPEASSRSANISWVAARVCAK